MLRHHLCKTVEKRRGIVWPRTGLGMKLNAEGGFTYNFQALYGLVVGVDETHFDIGTDEVILLLAA